MELPVIQAVVCSTDAILVVALGQLKWLMAVENVSQVTPELKMQEVHEHAPVEASSQAPNVSRDDVSYEVRMWFPELQSSTRNEWKLPCDWR